LSNQPYNTVITLGPIAVEDDAYVNISDDINDCNGFEYISAPAPCADILIGLPCDDGDENTIDDTIQEDCACFGTTDIYCTASAVSTNEWIQIVAFESINNDSGNDGGYGDYTNLSANCSRSGYYNIELIPDHSGPTYTGFWHVWIDFNQDGDFADAGEQVVAESDAGIINRNIQIPSNATLGLTRMRIAMRWNSFPESSCGELAYGEVEDYTINITDGIFNAQPLIGSIGIDQANSSISIYPNPVENNLVVELKDINEGKLEIYNNIGQLIETRILENEQDIQINTSNLQPGIYMLIVETENQEPILKRFIKN